MFHFVSPFSGGIGGKTERREGEARYGLPQHRVRRQSKPGSVRAFPFRRQSVLEPSILQAITLDQCPFFRVDFCKKVHAHCLPKRGISPCRRQHPFLQDTIERVQSFCACSNMLAQRTIVVPSSWFKTVSISNNRSAESASIAVFGSSRKGTFGRAAQPTPRKAPCA